MDECMWTPSIVRPYLLQREKLGSLTREDWQTTDGFGLPKRIRLRYPRTYALRMCFQVQVLPQDAELVLEKDALLGDATILLNEHSIDCWRMETEQGVRYQTRDFAVPV